MTLKSGMDVWLRNTLTTSVVLILIRVIVARCVVVRERISRAARYVTRAMNIFMMLIGRWTTPWAKVGTSPGSTDKEYTNQLDLVLFKLESPQAAIILTSTTSKHRQVLCLDTKG